MVQYHINSTGDNFYLFIYLFNLCVSLLKVIIIEYPLYNRKSSSNIEYIAGDDINDEDDENRQISPPLRNLCSRAYSCPGNVPEYYLLFRSRDVKPERESLFQCEVRTVVVSQR